MDRHKAWIIFDNYKRINFLKNEVKRFILKSLLKNKKINYAKKYLISYYLTNLPKFSTRTMIRNRCLISGRVWSLNKKTNLSRFIFRSKIIKSNLPGYKRAS